MERALKEWDRIGVTWCRTVGDRKMEISRSRNPDTGLIEWHTLVWEGAERSTAMLDAFHGDELKDALGAVQEVADV